MRTVSDTLDEQLKVFYLRLKSVCVFHFHLFFAIFTVVKTTVLLADLNDFVNVNDVYKQCKYDTVAIIRVV